MKFIPFKKGDYRGIFYLCAFKQLLINIATVKAHTHQGTGVILCHAESIFFVSASPYIFQSITVNQTSITILHCFNIFSFNNHGCQAAIIIISAHKVYLETSFVLLLQLITVAQELIKIEVIGFQTILLLHITHISFQTRSISIDENISIIPAGVHGTSQVLSHIRIFH